MNCIETIKEKKYQNLIEIYDLNHDEFKTKLKTLTDVEKMIDSYTTIYVYFAPRKQVLQILGNYKPGTTKIVIDKDGNEKVVPVYTKTIIYNYKKKKHKDISELMCIDIYSQLLEFCSIAEQLIMLKNFEKEEEEIEFIRSLSSEKINREKIREFVKE